MSNKRQKHIRELSSAVKTCISKNGQHIVGVIIVLTLGAALIWCVSTWLFVSGDLVNNLWAPARLLVRSESPYATEDLPPVEGVDWLPPVWMPTAIGLFFPMGWLTPIVASQIWLLASVVIIIVVAWLAESERYPPVVLFGLGVLSVIMFPPFGRHLTLGQYSVLATFMLLLAGRLVFNPRYLLAGFCVAVSLAKPQVGLLVIPGLFVAYGRYHRLRGLVLFGGALVLWVILLTVPLWAAYPRWFGDLLTALRLNQEQQWVQPSLLALMGTHIGDVGRIVWGVVAACVFSINIWLWLKLRPETAVIWSLGLTPLVTPYVWSWDFVLLIPMMLFAIYRFRSKLSFALLGLAYVFCWAFMFRILTKTEGQEARFWWIPWLFVFVICVGFLVDAQPLVRLRTLQTRVGKRSLLQAKD